MGHGARPASCSCSSTQARACTSTQAQSSQAAKESRVQHLKNTQLKMLPQRQEHRKIQEKRTRASLYTMGRGRPLRDVKPGMQWSNTRRQHEAGASSPAGTRAWQGRALSRAWGQHRAGLASGTEPCTRPAPAQRRPAQRAHPRARQGRTRRRRRRRWGGRPPPAAAPRWRHERIFARHTGQQGARSHRMASPASQHRRTAPLDGTWQHGTQSRR